MSVTSGSYTVGSGGDYATWRDASIDCYNQTLTGDLTFTQISDVTETLPCYGLFVVFGAYTLIITSNKSHNGDPTKGWITTINYNDNYYDFFVINGTAASSGYFKIYDLNLKISSPMGTLFHNKYNKTTGPISYIYNNIVLSNANNYAYFTRTYYGNCPYTYYFNNVLYNITQINEMYFSIGARQYFYNTTAYNCLYGFHVKSNTLVNCAVFGSDWCYSDITVTPIKCASSDDTGSSGLINLTDSKCFTSLDSTKSNFLDILQGGPLWETGYASLSTGQTADIRGRSIPNKMGKYSIGASTAWLRSLQTSDIVV